MKFTSHPIKDLCPLCEVTFLSHVHCPNGACAYCLTVCVECDRAQAVDRVMDDHVKDCAHAKTVARAA